MKAAVPDKATTEPFTQVTVSNGSKVSQLPKLRARGKKLARPQSSQASSPPGPTVMTLTPVPIRCHDSILTRNRASTRPGAVQRARQQADGLTQKTEANLPSGQIVGVSSMTSLCGSTMNLQPSLGSMNRTRVG